MEMPKIAGNRWRRKSRNWNSRQSIRGYEGECRVEGVVDNQTRANPVIIVVIVVAAVAVAVVVIVVVASVVVVVVKALYCVRQSETVETR
jgi:hypothetical protein